MAAEISNVLFSSEAEILVQSLDASCIENIGDKKWWSRHDLIEKLNMQAIVNVSSNTDEFVKDFLISFNKIGVLVYDLIVAELWAEKVFPFVKSDIDKNISSLPVYMALFHEATVLSLLETSCFYKETCESASDTIIDLVDYLNRKITKLVLDNYTPEENEEELDRQYGSIQFTIHMKSLSVLRYISDAIDCIPLSALTRVLDTHDFSCLLIQVLDRAPWKRNDSNGRRQIFNDNKWIDVAADEHNLITKLEGQVWLTLYQLLMHPEAQRKYEYNSYRKSEILKLRKYFNEIFLDQLPHLRDLQLFIEHLGVMETPSIQQNLIIEQIPEIRIKLQNKYEGKWKTIAAQQIKTYFSLNENQMKEQADRLAATYNLDVLESLLGETPVCANCQGEAMKRCSRCQSEWYCSRPCQVKHWAKHKSICNMLLKEEK